MVNIDYFTVFRLRYEFCKRNAELLQIVSMMLHSAPHLGTPIMSVVWILKVPLCKQKELPHARVNQLTALHVPLKAALSRPPFRVHGVSVCLTCKRNWQFPNPPCRLSVDSSQSQISHHESINT